MQNWVYFNISKMKWTSCSYPEVTMDIMKIQTNKTQNLAEL